MSNWCRPMWISGVSFFLESLEFFGYRITPNASNYDRTESTKLRLVPGVMISILFSLFFCTPSSAFSLFICPAANIPYAEYRNR